MEINDAAIKRLKHYLEIDGGNALQDETLEHAYTDAAHAVLSYCHVKRLNPALESVAVQMALRRVKEENEGLLTDIKMGDAALSYKAPASSFCFTETEKAVLNSYRRVILR